MIQDPIIYDVETNYLFVDISGFMGDKNANYKGLELYFQKSMNPNNLIPKVSRVFAENIVSRKKQIIPQIISELNSKM